MPSFTLPHHVHIEYFTDPLCSWSWALEPHWLRLRQELGSQLSWRYYMGGLLPDWERYDDPLNSVSRPAQMGPQWFHVRRETGMDLDERIWLEDLPASSYPACLAFKAAEIQGAEAAEAYLQRLRRAVMVERANIARPEVLLELAREVAGAVALDPGQLSRDLEASQTLEAFRSDLKEARYREIGRFPTLVLHGPGERAVLLVGYRPYEVLLQAVRHAASLSAPVASLPRT